MDDLDTRLLAAHDRDDKPALVALYSRAADRANDVDAECFFLTHAYVFALELGHPATELLHLRLLAHGRN